ncbi:hypothetical protein NDU88_007105 [Pleurodeles waltl]|uniref:Uncharacterized protein n=1 Tax=Pleurodeles waltl TaxID=8319 RepID=A0AAV7NZY4_PLEWA|nr:hypothetical protein NDU88_007105 [Pleurodeles waltl]
MTSVSLRVSVCDRFLDTTAVPVRGTRLGVSLRALCVAAPNVSAGRGGRSQPVDPLGGPRRSVGVQVPLRCVLALCGPRLGENNVEGPAPGPGAGAFEVWTREGWGPARAQRRSGQKGCPGRMSGAPHTGRRAALVLCASPCLRAVLPGRGQVGCCCAPAAAPQPRSPPYGRAAARAPQLRIPQRPYGRTKRGSPAAVCAPHPPRPGRFGFRSGRRLRLVSPDPLDHFRASCS